MEYVSLFGCAGLAGFVALLCCYDLSPKSALYKIMRRMGKSPQRLRPVTRDAPYRRIRSAKNSLHKPVLLNLETSDGSGQACHPDVVYIPGGFGSGRWPYWMVCTPLPYENESVENPEIFVSSDGMTWSIPEGLWNPIVLPPEVVGDHHSDPDMVHYEGKLWLFYRKSLRSQTPRLNLLYLMESEDGVTWSKPVEVMSEQEGRELLSPAVIHDGMRFVMWTIEIEGAEFKMMRRFSEHGLHWSAPERVAVSGMGPGRHLWHIDVIKEEDRLSAVLVSSIGRGGNGSRMHYAYSLDEGLNWHMSEYLFEQAYEFELQRQYRGSLRRLAEPQPCYELWYSAASMTNMFSIAYLRFRRPDN